MKSVTQSVKQRWTRLEYICYRAKSMSVSIKMREDVVGFVPARRTFMKSFICLRSIRLCSSRCSAAFSLLRNRGQLLNTISDVAPNAPLA